MSWSLYTNKQIISTSSIALKSEVYLLLSELSNCNEKARVTTANILNFQSLFHRICALNPYNQPPSIARTTTEISNALRYLNKSRDASQSLYMTLGHICKEHETHELYFNLDITCEDREAQYAFEFRFAFKRTDNKQDGLVWMRSCPFTRDKDLHMKPVGRRRRKRRSKKSNTTANDFPKPPLCLGQLAQNAEVKIDLGEGLLLEKTWNKNSERDQIQLSLFLESYREQSLRLRLARLISEAVLRLDTRLWHQKSLESSNVIVIAPSKYESVDSLESHIRVCLERQEVRHSSDYQQSQAHAHAVLFSLGLTLLELALSEPIQRPESEGFMGRITEPHLQEIKQKFDLVEDEMGKHYADAVRFCLFDCPAKGNLYDEEVQTHFYELVVRGLELQEAEDNEGKGPADNEVREMAAQLKPRVEFSA